MLIVENMFLFQIPNINRRRRSINQVNRRISFRLECHGKTVAYIPLYLWVQNVSTIHFKCTGQFLRNCTQIVLWTCTHDIILSVAAVFISMVTSQSNSATSPNRCVVDSSGWNAELESCIALGQDFVVQYDKTLRRRRSADRCGWVASAQSVTWCDRVFSLRSASLTYSEKLKSRNYTLSVELAYHRITLQRNTLVKLELQDAKLTKRGERWL